MITRTHLIWAIVIASWLVLPKSSTGPTAWAQEALPDLAYIAPDGSVWLIDPFSGAAVQVLPVLPNAEDVVNPPGPTDWSPDGRWLAAWSAYQVSVFQPPTGNRIEIQGYRNFEFLPDSSGMVLVGCVGTCFYEGSQSDIVVRRWDDPEPRRVTTSLTLKKHLDLTSDGRLALYTGLPKQPPFPEYGPPITDEVEIDYSLVTVDMETGEERAVVPALDPSPAYWFPDDRRVLFQSELIYCGDPPSPSLCGPTYIGVVDVNSGDVIKLRENDSLQGLAWSPSGEQAVVAVEEAVNTTQSGCHLYLFDSEQYTFIPLTSGADVWDANPTWSPDGQYIAFERCDPPAEQCFIYVMRSDGTEIRQIAAGHAPAWRPAAGVVVMATPEPLSVETTPTAEETAIVEATAALPMGAEAAPTWTVTLPAASEASPTPSAGRSLDRVQVIGLVLVFSAILGLGFLAVAFIRLQRNSG